MKRIWLTPLRSSTLLSHLCRLLDSAISILRVISRDCFVHLSCCSELLFSPTSWEFSSPSWRSSSSLMLNSMKATILRSSLVWFNTSTTTSQSTLLWKRRSSSTLTTDGEWIEIKPLMTSQRRICLISFQIMCRTSFTSHSCSTSFWKCSETPLRSQKS